jgi:hypothetical protein
MSDTYARLRPLLDVVGKLPRLLTGPVALVLYCLGRGELTAGRPYEALWLLDASYRVSGNRLLIAPFRQIEALVEVGQLDDALELKRWADRAVDRTTMFNDATRKYLHCFLNGLLPLHWHQIRQLPGEAVDPLSIDYKRVPTVFSGAMEINPALVARFVPETAVHSDVNGIPVLFRPGRDGRAPSVIPLKY